MRDLKKDFIQEFLKQNPRPTGKQIKEFADLIGCSIGYVYKVINETFLTSRVDLNPNNYAIALHNGYHTANALSRYFCVSVRTIQRFETEHLIIQKLSNYHTIFTPTSPKGVSPMGDVITILQGFKKDMDAVTEFEPMAQINSSKISYIIHFLQMIEP